jgi:UDP-N-acetylglucosamine pyrophosphorylase
MGATGESPTAPNGCKLESFIFDVFPLADSMAVLEVAREDAFAPVKNGPGAASDSPETALAAVSAQVLLAYSSTNTHLLRSLCHLCVCMSALCELLLCTCNAMQRVLVAFQCL